eukprot:TRINITY_DN76627_c0_g1_i1.p3 TRINITY_DN76627_c0_g1~~TRINITY_DN76627_c0_g1_i1.p3  ORF type:complete len:105 (+),score=13.90 TRINITY_DN76627_c0_g1_i1:138-452(+)
MYLEFADLLDNRPAFPSVDSRQSQQNIRNLAFLDQIPQMSAPENLVSIKSLAIQTPIIIDISPQSHGRLRTHGCSQLLASAPCTVDKHISNLAIEPVSSENIDH